MIETLNETNLKPSVNLKSFFQSKLNCEVLYDDLAFEVRWAVAGESIVIQLVAKLGEFFNILYTLIYYFAI
jgi:hypothetical protein